MSQELKCNCYINGKRKAKADRKTCTDYKTHTWNKQVTDHFQIVEPESDEEECETERELVNTQLKTESKK